jgi:hypothetical protein
VKLLGRGDEQFADMALRAGVLARVPERPRRWRKLACHAMSVTGSPRSAGSLPQRVPFPGCRFG